MAAVSGATSARSGNGGSARASSSRPCRSTPPASWPRHQLKRAFRRAYHTHCRNLYMDGYISCPRVDNTVYQLARPGRSGEDHLRQPSVRPVLPAAAPLASCMPRAAGKEGPPTIRLSIHGQGHARRPGSGGLQAVQPHRAPIPGNVVGCGRRREDRVCAQVGGEHSR